MRKILLIDDEVHAVELMQKSIQRSSNYDVQIAFNGQEGLSLARTFHPQLIITDVAMPIMDGFMFYRELRNSPELKNTPVVITSAYALREQQFRELGAKDFLVKPFNMTMLMTIVGSFFEPPAV
jgi:two-component system alkaline phosphatase synthesis response regulator PhoP